VADAVPAQVLKGDSEPDKVIEGAEPTVTVTLAVFWQPLASVPVTVYVTVLVNVAVTVEPVVALRPVEGDQL
jgi:hypothetical protein